MKNGFIFLLIVFKVYSIKSKYFSAIKTTEYELRGESTDNL